MQVAVNHSTALAKDMPYNNLLVMQMATHKMSYNVFNYNFILSNNIILKNQAFHNKSCKLT